MANVYPFPGTRVPVLTIQPRIETKTRIIEVKSISLTGLMFSFHLYNADLFIAARIREIILTSVPTMAVDCVEIRRNATIFNSENLAQILSLIVLDSNNVKNFTDSSGCDPCPDNSQCLVKYRLSKENKAGGLVGVSSGDLVMVGLDYGVKPVRYQYTDSKGQLVLADQSLFSLAPNHQLDIDLLAKKGTQSKRAKWACVSAINFDQENNYIKFNGELRGNLTINNILTTVAGQINNSYHRKGGDLQTKIEMRI